MRSSLSNYIKARKKSPEKKDRNVSQLLLIGWCILTYKWRYDGMVWSAALLSRPPVHWLSHYIVMNWWPCWITEGTISVIFFFFNLFLSGTSHWVLKPLLLVSPGQEAVKIHFCFILFYFIFRNINGPGLKHFKQMLIVNAVSKVKWRPVNHFPAGNFSIGV